jgi:hypothetical protein
LAITSAECLPKVAIDRFTSLPTPMASKPKQRNSRIIVITRCKIKENSINQSIKQDCWSSLGSPVFVSVNQPG